MLSAVMLGVLAQVVAPAVPPAGQQVYASPSASPKLLKRVEPEYPDDAVRAGFAGVVVLQAMVDGAGKVAEVRVIRGIPLLNEPAMAAVRRWKYEPLRLNGTESAFNLTVTLQFQPGSRFRGYDAGVISRLIRGKDADASGYAAAFAADHAGQFKPEERKKLLEAVRAALSASPTDAQAMAAKRALAELEKPK